MNSSVHFCIPECFPAGQVLCPHTRRCLMIDHVSKLRSFQNEDRQIFLCVEDLAAMAFAKSRDADAQARLYLSTRGLEALPFVKVNGLTSGGVPEVVHTLPVRQALALFVNTLSQTDNRGCARIMTLTSQIINAVEYPGLLLLQNFRRHHLSQDTSSALVSCTFSWNGNNFNYIPSMDLDCGTLTLTPIIQEIYADCLSSSKAFPRWTGLCTAIGQNASHLVREIVQTYGSSANFFPGGVQVTSGGQIWCTLKEALTVIAMLPHLSPDKRETYAQCLCDAWGMDPRSTASPPRGWYGQQIVTVLRAERSSEQPWLEEFFAPAIVSPTPAQETEASPAAEVMDAEPVVDDMDSVMDAVTAEGEIFSEATGDDTPIASVNAAEDKETVQLETVQVASAGSNWAIEDIQTTKFKSDWGIEDIGIVPPKAVTLEERLDSLEKMLQFALNCLPNSIREA